MKIATKLVFMALVFGTSQIASACMQLMPVGAISCAGGGPSTWTKQRAQVNHANAGGTIGCYAGTKFNLVNTSNVSVPGSQGNIGVGGFTTPPLSLVAGQAYKFQIKNADGSLLSEAVTKVAPSCSKVISSGPIKKIDVKVLPKDPL